MLLVVLVLATRRSADATLDVELSGCAAVRTGAHGAVCELPPDGAIRVWTREPVTFPDANATMMRTIAGGVLHRVVVKADARYLRIVAGRSKVAIVQLAARAAPAWLEQAKALRQKGDIEGALARVPATSADPVDRAFATGFRGRLALAAGRPDEAFPRFREAVVLHRQTGRISDAADDSFALAFALNQRSHEYAEARAVLDAAAADVAHYPDGLARLAYYRGTLATETGDARNALRLLREAHDHASRLGLGLLERNAVNAYALQLELVGRTREALDVLAGLAADATEPCERLEIAINVAFGSLLLADRGDDVAGDTTLLERAAEGACIDTFLKTVALGNLAFAALQRGDLARARARLAEARASVKAADVRAVEVLFWHELEGRIAFAEGDDVTALAAFDEEARIARASRSLEAASRAAVGAGTVLERLGRNEEALAQYRAAEELLTDVSLRVPLGEGRGSFVGDHEKSARFAVDLLVRLGRPREAFEIARASRARVIAALVGGARVGSLGDAERARWEEALRRYRDARAALDREARDDWKLSRTELLSAREARASREAALRGLLDDAFAVLGHRTETSQGSPRPRGVGSAARESPGVFGGGPVDDAEAITFAFHPVRRGWVELVADASGVTASPIAVDAPERLLVSHAERIRRARRLRVLPHGPFRAMDFHALPFDGRPLVATISVEYPLDLETVRDEGGGRALVVFDPTLDLSSSREEASHVSAVLRERGWTVDALGGPQATSAATLPLLGTARLFHYAGHGVFAGREGWESDLPLSGGSHLSIGDVLAASTVPSRIVLSGCETARTSETESLGLAQAFVLAGSAFAIAPIRPVDDALAAAMSRALYAGSSAGELASPAPVDAAAVLRDAQLRLMTAQPTMDWSAFRVVTR